MPLNKKLKILVVDDAQENVALLAKFLAKLGHTPMVANNGVQALRLFETEAPDLVLMDVMMPEMDGYEATRRIRELCGSRWVPVIFLSALGQEANVVKGLESGGDDYLTKPINLVVLQAKIRAMQRIAHLQREISDKVEELERYYDHAEQEIRVGSHIMDHIVNTRGLQDELLQYWISPAQNFSGDLVAAARTPGGVFHVMLADGAGHGLSAALNVLPLTQVFYSMTEKGFALSSIVDELNHKINTLMPVDRFVSATLAAVNTRENTIEVWNGGNPQPFILNERGELLHAWASKHVPLGILKRDKFDARPDVYNWDAPCQIFLCSDGLLEAENPNGEQFGQQRMIATLSATPPNERFVTMLRQLDAHLDGHGAHDDVTLIMVTLPLGDTTVLPQQEAEKTPGTAAESCSQWQLHLSFGESELRYLDAVPLLMNVVEQIQGIQAHVSPVYLILSELFNNALDHGLLRLDSTMKHLPGGFEQYLNLRHDRLETLKSGRIDLGVELVCLNQRMHLKIRIRDSGPGFNYADHLNKQLGNTETLHGRGISLVRNLCEKLEYIGNGNEVIAYYAL